MAAEYVDQRSFNEVRLMFVFDPTPREFDDWLAASRADRVDPCLLRAELLLRDVIVSHDLLFWMRRNAQTGAPPDVEDLVDLRINQEVDVERPDLLRGWGTLVWLGGRHWDDGLLMMFAEV